MQTISNQTIKDAFQDLWQETTIPLIGEARHQLGGHIKTLHEKLVRKFHNVLVEDDCKGQQFISEKFRGYYNKISADDQQELFRFYSRNARLELLYGIDQISQTCPEIADPLKRILDDATRTVEQYNYGIIKIDGQITDNRLDAYGKAEYFFNCIRDYMKLPTDENKMQFDFFSGIFPTTRETKKEIMRCVTNNVEKNHTKALEHIYNKDSYLGLSARLRTLPDTLEKVASPLKSVIENVKINAEEGKAAPIYSSLNGLIDRIEKFRTASGDLKIECKGWILGSMEMLSAFYPQTASSIKEIEHILFSDAALSHSKKGKEPSVKERIETVSSDLNAIKISDPNKNNTQDSESISSSSDIVIVRNPAKEDSGQYSASSAQSWEFV